MNQHDKDNLNFLLSASPEVLLDWYNSVEEDDHIYASELLAAYQEEVNDLEEKNIYEFEIEEELVRMSGFPEVDAIMNKCKYLH